MAALLDREFQDMTLEINTTVVAANDCAVGLVHPSRSHELLMGQQIDRAIRGIDTFKSDVDRLTKDIN